LAVSKATCFSRISLSSSTFLSGRVSCGLRA
jgi:hypothetical protein